MIKWEKLGLSRGPFTHPPHTRVHVYLDDASQTPADVKPYDSWPYHVKLSLDLEMSGRLHGLIWIGLKADDYGTKLLGELLDTDVVAGLNRTSKWRWRYEWEHLDIQLTGPAFDTALEMEAANKVRDSRQFRIQRLVEQMAGMTRTEIDEAIAQAGFK